MTERFIVGRTYECRSMSDYDTVYSFTVVSRTTKFITTVDRFGDKRRSGVWVGNGGEWAAPYGKYANAAVICASAPAN